MPCVVGLNPPLQSLEDLALDQPAEYQHGVNLLLEKLQSADRQGDDLHDRQHARCGRGIQSRSRPVAAEGRRIYMNIGNASPAGERVECGSGRARLRAHPAIRPADLLVPLLWCPYGTYWKFRQADVFDAAPPGLQNFFVLRLTWVPTGRPRPGRTRRSARLPDARCRPGSKTRSVPARIAICGARRRSSTPPVARLSSVRRACGRQCRPANRPRHVFVEPFDFVPGRLTVDSRGRTTFQEGGRWGDPQASPRSKSWTPSTIRRS